MIQFLLSLSLLLMKIHAGLVQIATLNVYSIANQSSTTVNGIEWDSTDTHAIFTINTPTYSQILFKPNFTSSTHQYTMQKTLMVDNITKGQRTHPENDMYPNSTQHTSFSDSSCKIVYNYNFSNYRILYTNSTSTQKVCDCRFGISISENFVIILDSGANVYALAYFLNFSLVGNVSIGSSTSVTYYSSKIVDKYMYIMLSSGIYIYTADINMSLIKKFPTTTASQISFDANQKYFVMSNGSIFHVYNLTNNYSYLYNISSAPKNILDLQLYSSVFVIVEVSNEMYLFDLELKFVTSWINFKGLLGDRLRVMSDKYVYLYGELAVKYVVLLVFQIDASYTCSGSGCTSCYAGYVLNAGICTKTITNTINTTNTTNTNATNMTNTTNSVNTTNSTNTTVNITSNITGNTTTNTTINVTTANTTTNATVNGTLNTTTNITVNTTVNGTANITVNNTTINITVNITVNNTVNNTNIPTVNTTNNTMNNGSQNFNSSTPNIQNNTQSINDICLQINSASQLQCHQKSQFINISNLLQDITPGIQAGLGNTLKLSSLRFTTKILISYVLFLDDIQYYQYHRINYTQTIQFCLDTAKEVNAMRFSPWFLEFLENYQLNEQFQQDQLYSPMINHNENDPNHFYFLASSQEIYIGNFLTNIIMFIVLKILHLIFFVLKHSIKIFNTPYKWFRINTPWWTLLIMLLETNLIRLTFNVFLQFQPQMIGYFNFSNKTNFVVTVFVLLSLILYSLLFYVLVYQFQKKRKSQILLNQTEPLIKGYAMQSVCRVFRNLLRGFFHGFLIQNYKIQIICLAWSNITYLIFQIICYKSFINFAVFIFVFGYYFVYFWFDLLLAVHYLKPELFMNVNYNIVTLIFICTLIGITIIISLIFVILTIIMIIKYVVKKLRIFEQNPSEEQIKKQFEIKKQKLENKLEQLFNFKTAPKPIYIKVQELKQIKKKFQKQNDSKFNQMQVKKQNNMLNIVQFNKLDHNLSDKVVKIKMKPKKKYNFKNKKNKQLYV